MRGMKGFLTSLLLGLMVLGCGGGGSVEDIEDENDPAVVGTWTLIEVDGEDASEYEYTIEFDGALFEKSYGCDYYGIYETDQETGKMRVTFMRVSGSACSNSAQDRETWYYEVSGERLSIEDNDVEYVYQAE